MLLGNVGIQPGADRIMGAGTEWDHRRRANHGGGPAHTSTKSAASRNTPTPTAAWTAMVLSISAACREPCYDNDQ